MRTPGIAAVAGRGARILAGCAALVAAGAATTLIIMTSSDAATPPPQAVAVPDKYVPTIFAAAAACPALTPPRVAAQLMAESGFSAHATTPRGGRGIAGLTDEAWQKWAPWLDALRTDDQANIVALAHLMCDLVGHIRVASVNGDPWQLALAAYATDLGTVRAAGATPSEARTYVDTVAGYAASYSGLTAFGYPDVDQPVSATATASPTGQPTLPTPTRTPSKTAAATPPTRPAGATSAPPVPTPTALPVLSPTTVPGPIETALRGWQSSKCLEADDGTGVFSAPCDGSAAQQWSLEVNGELTFIRNVKTGRCLDGNNTGATYTSGCWWNDGGQRWNLIRYGSGEVTAFRVVHSLFARCLDIGKDADTTDCRTDVWSQLWFVAALT